MAVGTGNDIDVLSLRITDHFNEIGMHEGFANIPQTQEKKRLARFIHETCEFLDGHHAFGSSQGVGTGWTERTVQIAQIGGFDHEHERLTKEDRSSYDSGEEI